MKDTWRIIDLIKWGEKYFKQKGFINPKNEIEWLICNLLDCKRLDIYMRYDETLSKSQLTKLRSWIKRRTKKEPNQYIKGSCDFYGRQFIVNQKVLIPRPETERIIDIALDYLENNAGSFILDIGTGSGCLGITIALERDDSIVKGIDYSNEIINIAQINSDNLNAKNISFSKMDILKELPNRSFDLILSNPPYISNTEYRVLMEDVKDFEPKLALTDSNDGLTFYKRFANVLNELLSKGGMLIIEVGLGSHSLQVKNIFENAGYNNIKTFDDYNGDQRVITINLN